MAAVRLLDVEIDYGRFGRRQAVFYLTGIEDAVRRVEAACAPHGDASAVAKPDVEDRGTASGMPEPDQSVGPGGGGMDAHSSERLAPEQSRQTGENSPTPALPPPEQPSAPSVEAALERPELPPAPSTGDRKDGDQNASGTIVAVPAVPPAGQDQPPPDGTLAAFLQRHGANRWGEVIYDWHKQCLDHAGVDREGIWYLSNDELTYLSKGETDQVRLTMLISTTRDLDVPPRRITCFGTARGRELTILRAE